MSFVDIGDNELIYLIRGNNDEAKKYLDKLIKASTPYELANAKENNKFINYPDTSNYRGRITKMYDELSDISPIDTEIDSEINALIYDLYGLSDNERAEIRTYIAERMKS